MQVAVYCLVDAGKAVVVRRLFELRYIFKNWSFTQLAKQLNVEGYCTAKGKQFTKVQVKRMLDRENFYRGMYKYGKIQTKGQHAVII